MSLAAALALPHGFPERDLLIFLTLAVIFVTLVGQGLTLPLLIRRLDVHDDGAVEREELHARRQAAEAAIAELERLGDEEWTRDDTVERMTALYEFRRRRLSQRAASSTATRTTTSTTARRTISGWSATCWRRSDGAWSSSATRASSRTT